MSYCGFWISELCLGFSNVSVEPVFPQLQINYEKYGTIKTISCQLYYIITLCLFILAQDMGSE